MENGSENNHGRNDDGKFRKTLLRLIFAAGGLMLLFNGSFFKNQFEDVASLKGMFFIILSLGVGLFVFVPEECNHKLEKLCNSYFLVNALVKFLLLGLFSMLIFFTKYPALKIQHLEGKRSQKVYDFLGVGSFSLFALLISWERQHGAAGFGVFEFMLELTMDASMDIPAGHEDGSGPDRRFMVGAYVYCFLLLIIRCYRNHSLSTEQHLNDSPSREDSHASGNDHGRASESVNRKVDGLSSEQHENGLSTEQHQNDSQEGNALTEVGNYQMEGLRSRRARREEEPAAAAVIRPRMEQEAVSFITTTKAAAVPAIIRPKTEEETSTTVVRRRTEEEATASVTKAKGTARRWRMDEEALVSMGEEATGWKRIPFVIRSRAEQEPPIQTEKEATARRMDEDSTTFVTKAARTRGMEEEAPAASITSPLLGLGRIGPEDKRRMEEELRQRIMEEDLLGLGPEDPEDKRRMEEELRQRSMEEEEELRQRSMEEDLLGLGPEDPEDKRRMEEELRQRSMEEDLLGLGPEDLLGPGPEDPEDKRRMELDEERRSRTQRTSGPRGQEEDGRGASPEEHGRGPSRARARGPRGQEEDGRGASPEEHGRGPSRARARGPSRARARGPRGQAEDGIGRGAKVEDPEDGTLRTSGGWNWTRSEGRGWD